MQVTLVSFGFKHGVPLESDSLFDVRFLPNPHFVPRLRALTGRDQAVVEYMEKHPATHRNGRCASTLAAAVPHPAVRRTRARPT